mmetsp:Transcript_45769/g.74672  ORF Transcript_45769/g.74672 Transcript_45769/m.74672 type:complete len:408 (+) Transcript_45769:3-1226(+)
MLQLSRAVSRQLVQSSPTAAVRCNVAVKSTAFSIARYFHRASQNSSTEPQARSSDPTASNNTSSEEPKKNASSEERKTQNLVEDDPDAEDEKKSGWGGGTIFLLLSLTFGAAVYYSPDPPPGLVEGEGNANSDISILRWNPVFSFLRGLRLQGQDFTKTFTHPSRDKLLPELPPPPPGVPNIYTLVLDLDDTLVHSVWDRQHGWRTQKRPGVDAFLAYMAQFYEIVLFTTGLPDYVDPIVNQLDPHGYIAHRLYRDATLYKDGHHVKDLSPLNRDLSRVVLVDDIDASLAPQPDNLVPVKPFSGNPNDLSLLYLVPFLENLVRESAPDVRRVIRSYEGHQLEIPAKFKERQRELERRQREAARHPFGLRRGVPGGSEYAPPSPPKGSIWQKLGVGAAPAPPPPPPTP